MLWTRTYEALSGGRSVKGVIPVTYSKDSAHPFSDAKRLEVRSLFGTLVITSDVHATGLPHIEVYGTEGSLRCIDPNLFGGPILLRKADGKDLEEVPCPFGYNGNSRGVGIADLAVGLRTGRPHRAAGAMGYHVIDIVHALHEASAEGRHIMLSRTCDQPAPLPLGLEEWTID